ncbi:Bromodomain protein [Entamoeba marina]
MSEEEDWSGITFDSSFLRQNKSKDSIKSSTKKPKSPKSTQQPKSAKISTQTKKPIRGAPTTIRPHTRSMGSAEIVSEPPPPSRGKKPNPMPIDDKKKCQGILARLTKLPESYAFLLPVDPEALGIPTYFNIIKNPMDLGTIQKKLTKNTYSTRNDFAQDVRLTFENAKLFNPVGNLVHTYAVTLLKLFENYFRNDFREHSLPQTQKTQLVPLTKEERKELSQQLQVVKGEALDEVLRILEIETKTNNRVTVMLKNYSTEVLRKLQKVFAESPKRKRVDNKKNIPKESESESDSMSSSGD